MRAEEGEPSASVLETILNTSPVGIVVFSTDREVLRVNSRAQEILEMSRTTLAENVENALVLDVVNADGEPLTESGLPSNRVLETGEAVYNVILGLPAENYRGDESATRRGGATGPEIIDRYTWISVNAAPLRDDDGDIDRIVSTFEDVTERRRRAAELARQNERLEEFASVVSHDLRNPITVAKGFLEIARENGDESAFDRVEEAHERMSALVDDLLVLAREGQDLQDTEPVDVAAVATDAWSTADTGDADLSVTVRQTVDADRARLRTLFENLFRNAVEHGSTGNQTPSGDAVEHGSDTVAVSVTDLDDAAGFAVSDDGPGIPLDQRDQVFDRGYSTDNGTGYGLAIVREVVEAHDWTVRVCQGEAGGARFEVEF